LRPSLGASAMVHCAIDTVPPVTPSSDLRQPQSRARTDGMVHGLSLLSGAYSQGPLSLDRALSSNDVGSLARSTFEEGIVTPASSPIRRHRSKGAQKVPWNATIAYKMPMLAFQMMSLSRYPDAVCNDGSPAAYYWRMGRPATKRWLVFLEGGGWCSSKDTCKARCGGSTADWCSSESWHSNWNISTGILVQDELEELVHAHKIYIPSCSSDAFMGNGRQWGMEFRGARIVEAVFKDITKFGLGMDLGGKGSDNDHIVIMGGESAGARGAMVHLDYVTEFLGKTAARVRTVGFLDSPLWMDIPPLPSMIEAGTDGFRKSCREVTQNFNVSHFGAECAAQFPKAQRFKCIMGEYRLKYIRAPLFLIAAAYDSFQISVNVGLPSVGRQFLWAEGFRNRTEQWAEKALTIYSTRSMKDRVPHQITALVPACFSHSRTSTYVGFTEDTVKGARVLILFKEFMNAVENGDDWYMIMRDECKGFACGPGCPELTASGEATTEGSEEAASEGSASGWSTWSRRGLALAGAAWFLLSATW